MISIRKYVGLFLSLIASLIAFIFSLPVILSSIFTLLSGKLLCWAEEKHTYQAHQTLLGVRLEDLRCIRCGNLISGKDKVAIADEILNLNLNLDAFNQQIATEKIIEESKEDEDLT